MSATETQSEKLRRIIRDQRVAPAKILPEHLRIDPIELWECEPLPLLTSVRVAKRILKSLRFEGVPHLDTLDLHETCTSVMPVPIPHGALVLAALTMREHVGTVGLSYAGTGLELRLTRRGLKALTQKMARRWVAAEPLLQPSRMTPVREAA